MRMQADFSSVVAVAMAAAAGIAGLLVAIVVVVVVELGLHNLCCQASCCDLHSVVDFAVSVDETVVIGWMKAERLKLHFVVVQLELQLELRLLQQLRTDAISALSIDAAEQIAVVDQRLAVVELE